MKTHPSLVAGSGMPLPNAYGMLTVAILLSIAKVDLAFVPSLALLARVTLAYPDGSVYR